MEPSVSNVEIRSMVMRVSERNAEIIPSTFLPGIHAQNMMERMGSTSPRINRADRIL